MNWKPHVINEGSLYITYRPQWYKSPTLSGSVCECYSVSQRCTKIYYSHCGVFC